MSFDLEKYISDLPEDQRAKVRKQMQHSVSNYTLQGVHLPLDHEKENLLEVLEGMERYVVDSNSNWKAESKKPENRNKAFILGRTITDEEDNLKGVYFGSKVDIANNNLFEFGIHIWKGKPMLKIDRLDEHFRITFDPQGLNEESRQRNKRRDAEFLELQEGKLESIRSEKRVILGILEIEDLNPLPNGEEAQKLQSKLVRYIRLDASRCFKDFGRAMDVARCCYASLLLEASELGNAIRKEFEDDSYKNVFGDTVLVQNALFLRANLLSGDKAVKKMAEYIALPEIVATEKVI